MKKLTHPLGKTQTGVKPGPAKGMPIGAPANVVAAVAALKPIVKLPGLAAQASNTELRKP